MKYITLDFTGIKTLWELHEYFKTVFQLPHQYGRNMDAVWENIIVQIGGITIAQGNTLDEQIAVDDQKAKLQKEISRLEKLARAEKQPKKKFELARKINKLKQELEG